MNTQEPDQKPSWEKPEENTQECPNCSGTMDVTPDTYGIRGTCRDCKRTGLLYAFGMGRYD